MFVPFNIVKPADSSFFKRRFFKDFIDLNIAMWNSNNALTVDPAKEPDALTSLPWEWPLSLVGLRMCGWGLKDIKYFLMGHPLVWWGVAYSVIGVLLVMLIYAIRAKRNMVDFTNGILI